MRILFVMFRPKYVNTYDGALRLLAERGHSVHFAFSMGQSSTGRKPFVTEPVERLARDFPGAFTWDVDAPERDPADGWLGIAYGTRIFGDFWRYAHPRYAHAPLLRDRVGRRAERYAGELPGPLGRPLWAASSALVRRTSARWSDRLLRLARALERAIPASARVREYVAAQNADIVLVTPLVDVASSQAEFVKAAGSLGIPSAICVSSWDNLTNKGTIRVDADAVVVWNEAQRTEAVELHGVAPDSVVVTGAQKFDEWFARKPSRSAEELNAAVGLPPSRRYLLYVCSSRFIAGDEKQFVERWLEAVRAVPELRDLAVLIRPHPENGAIWRSADLSRFADVAVYPAEGAEVTGDDARADFFDSLFHSEAVVGINTSAMIEAAIVGKSVYTILDESFRGAQEGTLHFHHLLHERGGMLHVARTLPEHAAQLAAGLRDRDDDALGAFVESFVRPHGLDVPASPIVADAIERIARTPARGPVHTPASRALSVLLRPLAAAQRRTAPPAEAIGLADRVIGKQLELELGALRRRPGTIVVGPWLGDSEEELLYWIPYVRRLVRTLGLDAARLTAVSHGGVARWYEGVCGGYADLSELIDPALLDEALVGWLAQRDAATRDALAQLGVDAAATIPPSAARRLFRGYRAGRAPLEIVREFTELQLLADGGAPTGPIVAEDGLEALLPGAGCVALETLVDAAPRAARRGAELDAVASASLLLARPGGRAALGIFAGVPTIAVADGSFREPNVELLAHDAQRLGGAFTLLDSSELPFVRSLAVSAR